jgi:DNA repair exonuclease SbcCD ATPase subunit
MRLRMLVALAVLGLGLPAGSAAQGLGETAARERARREQAGRKVEPARVFTNDDLATGRGAGEEKGEAAEPAPAASEAEGGSSGGSEDTRLPAEKVRAELDAVRDARNRVASLEAQSRQLQEKLNPMSGSFIYGPSGSNSANEEAQVREELNGVEADLAGARRELAQATEALQEASRRQSVPVPEPDPE